MGQVSKLFGIADLKNKYFQKWLKKELTEEELKQYQKDGFISPDYDLNEDKIDAVSDFLEFIEDERNKEQKN